MFYINVVIIQSFQTSKTPAGVRAESVCMGKDQSLSSQSVSMLCEYCFELQVVLNCLHFITRQYFVFLSFQCMLLEYWHVSFLLAFQVISVYSGSGQLIFLSY